MMHKTNTKNNLIFNVINIMAKEFKAPTRKNVVERAITKKGKKLAWLFTLQGEKLNELTKSEQRQARGKLRKDFEDSLANIFDCKDMDSYLDFCDFLNSYSILSFDKNGIIPVSEIFSTFSQNSYLQNNASKLQKIYDTLFVDKKKK